MADVFSKTRRSRVMATIRSRGNQDTELRLATLFRQSGIKGWRRHQPIFGTPDFVFRKQRVAVFVDGCFWHGCRWHCRMPKSNQEYWRRKISRNAWRDRHNTHRLRAKGWTVIRVWGHSLAKPEKTIIKIISVLSRRPQLCNHPNH